jgi:phosphohistidine phosphatase
MKIYLVRHGHALSEEEDPARPLSDRGRREVGKIAAFLGKNGVRVDRVLHSGKTRAQQTAAILADAVGIEVDVTEREGLAPNDPVEPFAEQIGNGKRDLMVVGHLPFLGRLVSYCVTGNAETPVIAFAAGAIACLQTMEDGEWSIGWFMAPEVLAD